MSLPCRSRHPGLAACRLGYARPQPYCGRLARSCLPHFRHAPPRSVIVAHNGSGGSWLMKVLPPAEAWKLLPSTWGMLQASFWPIIFVYAGKDAAAFILHRVGHRLTNLVAELWCEVPKSSIANPWWLHLESLDGNMGYHAVIAFFFLVILPLNIALNSYATSAVMEILRRKKGNAAKISEAPVAPGGLAPLAAESSSVPGGSADRDGPRPRLETADGSQTLLGSVSAAVPGPSSADTGGADTKQSTCLQQPSVTAAAASSAAASSSGSSWPDKVATMLGFGRPAAPPTVDPDPAAASASTSSAPEPGPGSVGLLARLKGALSEVWSVVPVVNGMQRRVWCVDLLFSLQALPLQALSLLVLPLPFTLPLLLSIQLSVPAAISEGLSGKAALDRSVQLMKGFGGAYAWPFVFVIVAIRAVDIMGNLMLKALPGRYWQEVIEVPLALIVLFGFAKMVIIRAGGTVAAAPLPQCLGAMPMGSSVPPSSVILVGRHAFAQHPTTGRCRVQDLMPVGAYLLASSRYAAAQKEGRGAAEEEEAPKPFSSLGVQPPAPSM